MSARLLDRFTDVSPLLSRRSFLVGTVSGSLVMAFGGLLTARSARAALSGRRFAPTVWFEMDPTGATVINVAKAEMGQHVGTALARVVAEELGVSWSDVSIRHVDTDPKWGYMVTGGSWSVFTTFKMLSQAGAAGRIALIEAAAPMLGVEPSACTTRDSRVICGDRSIGFADILAAGDIDRQFTPEELEALPIKPPAERQLIGKPLRSLDIRAKSTGEAVYGIDAEVPGMVYARPIVPPTRYGSTVKAVDDTAAKAVSGYQGYHVIEDPSATLQGWVVALADSYWGAVKSADAIQVDWATGPTAGVSEADIIERGTALAKGAERGVLAVEEGNVDEARRQAASEIESTYTTATALHFTLEPANTLAEFRAGKWHIHAGNQWQSLILPVLAKALQVEESDIVIHQYYLGGGFGRRLYGDYMLPAALTAKAFDKPVKAIFTREDDSRFDCARSPSVQHFKASLGANGEVTGVEHVAVAGWPTQAMAEGFMFDGLAETGKADPFATNGADHWYSLPSHRVRTMANDLAQKTFLPGWLRAVGPGWIGWGVECFMDELALAAGEEPIDFRLRLLDGAGKNAGSEPSSTGGARRLAAVLSRLRERSGWGDELPENEGRGVAVCAGQERNMPTWIACVAHVAVDRDSGEVSVRKLSLNIDCGTVIDPDGAMAQAQGAALWGLSLALHEGTAFRNGQVGDLNLDRYTPLRMADVPELDIEFAQSDAFPVGMGEPPLIVVGPAIGNAIFDAVGVRLRHLPIRAGAVKAAFRA